VFTRGPLQLGTVNAHGWTPVATHQRVSASPHGCSPVGCSNSHFRQNIPFHTHGHSKSWVLWNSPGFFGGTMAMLFKSKLYFFTKQNTRDKIQTMPSCAGHSNFPMQNKHNSGLTFQFRNAHFTLLALWYGHCYSISYNSSYPGL
jgi:hypothetical protein